MKVSEHYPIYTVSALVKSTGYLTVSLVPTTFLRQIATERKLNTFPDHV